MRLWFGAGVLALAVGMIALGLGHSARGVAADPPAAANKQPTLGGIPIFASWPQGQKPDAVLVLSGETYGMYQPCGCTRPQKGGLERRGQFIQSLKAKGWPVAAADLGDVFPENPPLMEQGFLKYKLTMNAMRDMGYLGVGLGKTEFKAQIDRVLQTYALQKLQRPFTLSGNVLGPAGELQQPRELRFQVPGETRPLVEDIEFAKVGTIPVSVSGMLSKSVEKEIADANLDPSVGFARNNKAFLQGLTAKIQAHETKPELNVLLFEGTSEEAKKVAGDWPEFQVILCRADDPEPPQFPETVSETKTGRKTLIIQVGHKGRYVGAIGAFRLPNGGLDLKYQLVPMGEEFITPGTDAEAMKTNPILPLMEMYAKQVKDRHLIDEYPRLTHPAQGAEPKLGLHYIGSDKCQACHVAEFNAWTKTHHSNAFNALVTAKRPGLRQFDGECIVCHTVGFGYKTGYEDQAKTPNLMNVGCENCHGPGSAHSADPRNKTLLKLQTPWAPKPGDRLPNLAFMARMAPMNGIQRGQVQVPPATQLIVNKVTEMCSRCHNHENDPNFDLYTNWPKIVHATPGKPNAQNAAGK